MKAKAVFLDRDGTINVEKKYLYRIEDFNFLPGVLEGLKILQDEGYLLIIVTNQSGIARGYYTEDDLTRLHNWMIYKLAREKIYIKKIYYCPHLPNAKITKYRKKCACRKPALGMYMHAVRTFGISLDDSYAIGDKIRDCAICKKTGCKGYLIGTNEKAEIIGAVKNGKQKNVSYASNLLAVAKEIEHRKI